MPLCSRCSAPSWPAFCTTSSWRRSPGCAWKASSCTSFSSRSSRRRSHASDGITSELTVSRNATVLNNWTSFIIIDSTMVGCCIMCLHVVPCIPQQHATWPYFPWFTCIRPANACDACRRSCSHNCDIGSRWTRGIRRERSVSRIDFLDILSSMAAISDWRSLCSMGDSKRTSETEYSTDGQNHYVITKQVQCAGNL